MQLSCFLPEWFLCLLAMNNLVSLFPSSILPGPISKKEQRQYHLSTGHHFMKQTTWVFLSKKTSLEYYCYLPASDYRLSSHSSVTEHGTNWRPKPTDGILQTVDADNFLRTRGYVSVLCNFSNRMLIPPPYFQVELLGRVGNRDGQPQPIAILLRDISIEKHIEQ